MYDYIRLEDANHEYDERMYIGATELNRKIEYITLVSS